MSDFGELCPLFNTGVYNELYLGRLTGSIYTTVTYNFLANPGSPITCPASFRFGRTVVVTECWFRRVKVANTTATISLMIGRRLLTGAAAVTGFGTITFADDPSAFPDFMHVWRPIGATSFTLATADCLQIGINGDGATGEFDIIVQYREK